MSENLNNTMKYDGFQEQELSMSEVIRIVYRALKERGYEPENQIVGYILSGDPTYITSHNDARKLVRQVERDDLLAAILKSYIENEKIAE
ncbi:MAG: IreB family regulatory phosphoprotein [Tissierellia bacterium]|nr:IreB family regulatory phosphoprotein [Bacillota bacterium]NLK58527.1 IreB family regulatory phosphoprotein [Tissierellia bacterium]